MRHALIIAGGSGTRLWPMSRTNRPKQLIPFIGGRSLIEMAWQRLDGLIPPPSRYICAGRFQQQAIQRAVAQLPTENYIGEPIGRDTLNAVALSTAIIAKRDPGAVVAILTADHIIEPVDKFQQILTRGFELSESHPQTLVTFGITPTHPATGYGYLELADPLGNHARRVRQFKETPDAPPAARYLRAGRDKYLWNSGMFVWQARTLLDCVHRYQPENSATITRLADAWGQSSFSALLDELYPRLKKISVDYAVMEPASQDPAVQVAAVPMPLQWLDVGSWPSFAATCRKDTAGNALATERTLLLDTHSVLVASDDPRHLIATVGCDNLIIIHTADATLVCRADRAEDIKKLHEELQKRSPESL